MNSASLLLSCKLMKTFEEVPNGHTTSNPHRFDVEITLILRSPKFDEFPRHFCVLFRCNFDGRKIHVVSTYCFWCDFDGRKIHVVSTYFYRCNFAGYKIHVVSTYSFWCNFHSRKIHVVSTYFFRCNFDGRNTHVVFTYFFRCNFDGQNIANENIRGGFSCVCNFKQLTFARLFSLNFSSKCPWCSPVPLKFESYNLRCCKNNCHKLVFLVFRKQLLYQIIFGWLHYYEVNLVKKCNKPLLQKCETTIFDQKRFIKNLLKVSKKNILGILRINQVMSKLSILSKCLQFWTCPAFLRFTFHILQTTWGILL